MVRDLSHRWLQQHIGRPLKVCISSFFTCSLSTKRVFSYSPTYRKVQVQLHRHAIRSDSFRTAAAWLLLLLLPPPCRTPRKAIDTAAQHGHSRLVGTLATASINTCGYLVANCHLCGAVEVVGPLVEVLGLPCGQNPSCCAR